MKKRQDNPKKINFSLIIPWIIPAICVLFITKEIVRTRFVIFSVKADPVETVGYVLDKRIITGGKGHPDIQIYYYFRDHDTIVYGSSSPIYKVAKQLEIGDRVLIHYNRRNPDYNLFYDTVSLDYISHH